jgi:hypothetical protein
VWLTDFGQTQTMAETPDMSKSSQLMNLKEMKTFFYYLISDGYKYNASSTL